MADQILSEKMALDVVRKEINLALGKRWMIAVWNVEEDDKGVPKTVNLQGRVTWRFPTGDFQNAVNLLTNNLKAEMESGVPAVPPPLEMADFLSEAATEMDNTLGRAEEVELQAKDEVSIDVPPPPEPPGVIRPADMDELFKRRGKEKEGDDR